MASDPLHLPDPGPELTPHSGRVQPADGRTGCTLSPRGRTRLFLIGQRGVGPGTPPRRDCMEGGGWRRDVLQTPPHPRSSICLSTKYAWTAETGGGTRGWKPIGNAEIRLLALISLWKTIISFFQRLVCVIQDLNGPFGSNISFLSSLGPCCIIFSSRSDTRLCKNL